MAMIQQPGDLGSFGETSISSRRKRGPVALRPNLTAGLPLSNSAPIKARLGSSGKSGDVPKFRYGSVAASRNPTSLAAAFGRIAVAQKRIIRSREMNDCFYQERSFNPHGAGRSGRRLTATSGRFEDVLNGCFGSKVDSSLSIFFRKESDQSSSSSAQHVPVR